MDIFVSKDWASGNAAGVLTHVAHYHIQDIPKSSAYAKQSPSHCTWELVLELNLQDAVEEANEVVTLKQILSVNDSTGQVTDIKLQSLSVSNFNMGGETNSSESIDALGVAS